MASWLAIDWDQDQFHLLSVQTTRRGAQVTSAVTWTHPEPFTPSTAERVGKLLREFIKTEKIAVAPVLIGIGRDRILAKELRFPPIAAHEEPALVRFQTAKELTEPADNYAIDYAHLNPTARDGERQIMTVAARRDIVAMMQTLCQAAGLKLHAVTPRLFGIGAALGQAVQPAASPLAPNKRTVVLTLGQRWAELNFYRGDRLVQAQALAKGTLLVSEVRRNLAVYQAQHAVEVDVQGPECLYVFGDDSATIEQLKSGLSLPIVVLDPLEHDAAANAGIKNPGVFAGAMGLALVWSQTGQRPVNLFSPKKQQAPVSVSRQRGMLYGAIGASAALLLIGTLYFILAGQKAEAERLALAKKENEDFLSSRVQERAEIESYKEWEQTTIPWLDELYDLTAHYPYESGVRVNQLAAGPITAKKNAKDGFVGRINLSGQTPTDKQNYVYDLSMQLSKDAHVKAAIGNYNKTGQGEAAGAPKAFTMAIDVAKQAASKYITELKIPASRIQPRKGPQARQGPPPKEAPKVIVKDDEAAEENAAP